MLISTFNSKKCHFTPRHTKDKTISLPKIWVYFLFKVFRDRNRSLSGKKIGAWIKAQERERKKENNKHIVTLYNWVGRKSLWVILKTNHIKSCSCSKLFIGFSKLSETKSPYHGYNVSWPSPRWPFSPPTLLWTPDSFSPKTFLL